MKMVRAACALRDNALSLNVSGERSVLRLLDSGPIIADADKVIVQRDRLFGLPRVAPQQR